MVGYLRLSRTDLIDIREMSHMNGMQVNACSEDLCLKLIFCVKGLLKDGPHTHLNEQSRKKLAEQKKTKKKKPLL